jgi:hypothetical protein
MRRILLLVTVALVMAAMMVVMAAPAIASHGVPGSHKPCPPGTRVALVDQTPGLQGVLITCVPNQPPS